MAAAAGGGDAKYFGTTKKGEVHELKTDLNSTDKAKIKEAVKKVIAAMTVGKDVSSLFTDVIKNMQTDNLELKKLIYLYIINYARSNPEKAILVVSTFQRDSEDKSPLVRALAIRTMGCIRVDRIIEYLPDPLARALKDKDPYVRKTAAVCVAKLWDINKDLVEEQGFLEALRAMIGDPNPMVVSNAVAALSEIAEGSSKDVFHIDRDTLTKLLAALNEATEWGQVFILDCLSRYRPEAKEAEDIVERVSPRLKHVNSAVAMSAVKVIMQYLPLINNEKLEKVLITEKLSPPLITLLSEGKPEIQYVALRNINLIVQKRPEILAGDVRAFFIKYNDPIYVKMEKLEIMIKLASMRNVEKVLMEFKEYASEVDVEVVRRSVHAIGRCAIKLDKAAERCITVLRELILTKVNYVVQEAIIVIKDIFRKYPNRYESIIAQLCENLDTLDEPEAKASMVWIIGEYADRIDNSPALLDSFVDTFEDENPQVQLQVLTAVVKLFLKRPEEAKDMVQKVLNMATQNSDNPDLRDRGYVYWRLLSTDPEAAQAVVLAAKPTISDDTFQLETTLLDVLISNISTLASIYHKPPELFVKDGKTVTLRSKPAPGAAGEGKGVAAEDDGSGEDSGEEGAEGGEVASDGLEEEEGKGEEGKGEAKEGKGAEAPAKRATAAPAPAPTPAAVADPLGLAGAFDIPVSPATGAATGAGATSSGAGLAGFFPSAAPTTPAAAPTPAPSTPPAHVAPSVINAGVRRLLSAEDGKGLQISATYQRRGGVPSMEFFIENFTTAPLANFALKFNINPLGFSPATPMKPGVVAPSGNLKYSLPLAAVEPSTMAAPGTAVPAPGSPVQMAIKTDLGIFYFADRIPAWILFEERAALESKAFLGMWGEIPESKEVSIDIPSRTVADLTAMRAKLGGANCGYVATRTLKKKGEMSYFSLFIKGHPALLEVTLNGPATTVCVKCNVVELGQSAANAIAELL